MTPSHYILKNQSPLTETDYKSHQQLNTDVLLSHKYVKKQLQLAITAIDEESPVLTYLLTYLLHDAESFLRS